MKEVTGFSLRFNGQWMTKDDNGRSWRLLSAILLLFWFLLTDPASIYHSSITEDIQSANVSVSVSVSLLVSFSVRPPSVRF